MVTFSKTKKAAFQHCLINYTLNALCIWQSPLLARYICYPSWCHLLWVSPYPDCAQPGYETVTWEKIPGSHASLIPRPSVWSGNETYLMFNHAVSNEKLSRFWEQGHALRWMSNVKREGSYTSQHIPKDYSLSANTKHWLWCTLHA